MPQASLFAVFRVKSYFSLFLINSGVILFIIIYFIYSLIQFPYKSIQTACYYKENPPVPIQRQKPCKCIEKVPYLRLTLRLTLRLALRQGKPIFYYLSTVGVYIGVYLPILYQYICKVQCYKSTSVVCLVVYPLPSSFFVLYIPFNIYSSIQLVYSKRPQGGILYFF